MITKFLITLHKLHINTEKQYNALFKNNVPHMMKFIWKSW